MTTDYANVRRRIESGDLLVRRGGGLVGAVGRNPARHVGMAVWRHADQSSLQIAESREWYGSRNVSFSSQVRQAPGLWDVYRPRDCPLELRERAATIALNWAGKSYDYPGAVSIWILENPLLAHAAARFGFYRDLTDTEPTPWDEAKKCSAMWPWAYRWATRELGLPPSVWDAVPNLNDRYITPGDLVRSGALALVHRGLVIDAVRHPRGKEPR